MRYTVDWESMEGVPVCTKGVVARDKAEAQRIVEGSEFFSPGSKVVKVRTPDECHVEYSITTAHMSDEDLDRYDEKVLECLRRQ